MSLIDTESGCKVGWEIYDNEPEAAEASERAKALATDKAERGYDFGYCVPGEIRHVENYVSRHVNVGGSRDEYGEVWIVTIP